MIAPNDDNYIKNRGVMEEIIARNAPLIIISDRKQDNQIKCLKWIHVPSNNTFTPLLSVVVTQLLAYYTAVAKSNTVDQPVNLAKTVTTD